MNGRETFKQILNSPQIYWAFSSLHPLFMYRIAQFGFPAFIQLSLCQPTVREANMRYAASWHFFEIKDEWQREKALCKQRVDKFLMSVGGSSKLHLQWLTYSADHIAGVALSLSADIQTRRRRKQIVKRRAEQPSLQCHHFQSTNDSCRLTSELDGVSSTFQSFQRD